MVASKSATSPLRLGIDSTPRHEKFDTTAIFYAMLARMMRATQLEPMDGKKYEMFADSVPTSRTLQLGP
jgi:hypothetical protein